MSDLGARIKELRREKGLGLREFARMIEVAPSFVVDIEAGQRRPGFETLTRIGQALSLSPGELEVLDPRLNPIEREALRSALTGDWDETLNALSCLDDWQLERLQKMADLLSAAGGEVLGRRHS